MPLSEISNALLVTYAATEYHVKFEKSRAGNLSIQQFLRSFVLRNRLLLLGLVVLNVLERVTGAASVLKDTFEQMLHAPKIILAALLYITSLYYDCLQYIPDLPLMTKFLPKVGVSFCRILPLYPFLAVLIAFFFGFLIEVFEGLHLPLRYLNWPIYYGTLYGPFSAVYFQVKQSLVEDERYTIPTTAAAGAAAPRSSTVVTNQEEVIEYQESDYFNPKIKAVPSDFYGRAFK